jgi:hypothetical protein
MKTTSGSKLNNMTKLSEKTSEIVWKLQINCLKCSTKNFNWLEVDLNAYSLVDLNKAASSLSLPT